MLVSKELIIVRKPAIDTIKTSIHTAPTFEARLIRIANNETNTLLIPA